MQSKQVQHSAACRVQADALFHLELELRPRIGESVLHSLHYQLIRTHRSNTMISHETLYNLANSLGILAMITVVGYHVVAVNSKYLAKNGLTQ